MVCAARKLCPLMQFIHSLITASAALTKDWRQNSQTDNRRFSSAPHRLTSKTIESPRLPLQTLAGTAKAYSLSKPAQVKTSTSTREPELRRITEPANRPTRRLLRQRDRASHPSQRQRLHVHPTGQTPPATRTADSPTTTYSTQRCDLPPFIPEFKLC